MKVKVFINIDKKDIKIKESIEKKLIDNNIVIDNDNPDLVLYLGGDGTFLRAVNAHFDQLDKVKFVGINYGNLGFFCEYQKDEVDAFIEDLKNNKFMVTEHKLLQADAVFEDKSEVLYAVNEVRIENPFRTMICDVLINNEPLESFHGNGLLVATSFGSSAFNKSLGGAIVMSDFECLQLTEIATIQNNFNRSLGSSLIVSNKEKITIKGNLKNTVLGYDYKTLSDGNLKELTIYLSDKKVKMLHKQNYSPLVKLRRSFIK